MQATEMYRPWAVGATAADAPLAERVSFIRRTYAHLTGASLLLVVVCYALYQAGFGEAFMAWMAQSRALGGLVWIGGMTVVSMLGNWMSSAERPTGVQYAGMALVVALWAAVLSPLLFLAQRFTPGVLAPAAILTLAGFGGLSAFAITTKKDFSFLRGALFVAGLVMLGVVVCSMIFGFSGGLWLPAFAILFACGKILYDTSNVVHHYRTDEHVPAAVQLFTSLAYLFYNVLLLLMRSRSRN